MIAKRQANSTADHRTDHRLGKEEPHNPLRNSVVCSGTQEMLLREDTVLSSSFVAHQMHTPVSLLSSLSLSYVEKEAEKVVESGSDVTGVFRFSGPPQSTFECVSPKY